jgi:hypothetical protein
MGNVFIYALSDPRNNQIRYIGKANNPKDRYTNHLNSARDKNTHKRNWINCVRKSGLRPELIIIDEVPKIEWVYWEKFYISLFKTWGFSLVNYTEGGDGSTFGNSGTFKKGNTPHNKGVPCSEESKQKIKDRLTGRPNISSYKPIIQYDINYNIVKKYKCIKDAVIESDGFFSTSKISACLTGKRKNHRNYIWKYDDGGELKKVYMNRKEKIGKAVCQYNDDNQLVGEFKSIKEAAFHVGGNSSNISFCCKNINRKSRGFYWRYKQIDKK